MNSVQQQIKIAEACGWTRIEAVRVTFCSQYYDGPSHKYYGNPPHAKDVEKSWYWSLPDYLNDLQAMHIAEECPAMDGKWKQYGEELVKLTTMGQCTWHATAAQRAEAFLKTLNLWVA